MTKFEINLPVNNIKNVDVKNASEEKKEGKKEGKIEKKKTQFEFDMQSTIKNAVGKITKWGDVIKVNPNSYELETRLMLIPSNSHKLSVNIPDNLFDKILNFYTKNVRHYKLVPWYYTFDHYFPNDIRRRETNPGPLSSNQVSHSVVWCKKKLFDNDDWRIDGRPLSMRVSLKREEVIDEPWKFTRVSTGSGTNGAYINTGGEIDKKLKSYHVKQTCSFQDKAVTIFFSYVWEGENEEKAELAIVKRTIEVEVFNKSIGPITRPEEIVYNLIARTVELQGLNSPCSLSQVKRL